MPGMAEAAVRPATTDDVPEIARVHRDTWRTGFATILPAEVLDGIDVAETAAVWAEAVDRGQVLVATEGDWLVGFCAVGIAPREELADAQGVVPDDSATTALVSTLLVEPRWGRRGHGGRLLARACELLVEGGVTRGVAWVPEANLPLVSFYAKRGWGADGTVRTLDASGRPVRELRLSGSPNLDEEVVTGL
ncbi:GCN5-related N-acetyltransferase [Actinosynnema pretiosum subsp. pretiosum]|nr:GCN5-related N-acetyltransferase [Actinosynnema pretiosum subsp. pretiosum]